ncbi:acetolactate synthase AlsS [Rathayibacter sp. VKM Ac-2762]|uniref:acetolactate synthase AlsS n=1 Tax=Rathayibacter sp. VKM Ac-2762 TaxID=2609254 RepID=UPI00132EECEE|nr:acetolactate synthase AlsS [Rathayibacter sp. VKM Ac-2762]QHF21225.1 acetolactate synthase AlsS [Rathayibacter sp. VKM Ac-2762]
MEQPNVETRSARRVIETLTANGVKYVFGIPGAKIDAVFDVLADEGPELIVCRHEQNAAFMAAAVGRLTGSPGVVLVTSGPGTTNLATGLLTANTEQDPVVALAGAVQLSDRLKRTHQSMDAAAFLSTVTKYTVESTDPDDVSEAVSNAFRAAVTEPRGAAAVVLSASVMAAPTSQVITRAATGSTSGPARAEDLTHAADLINTAERPVLLVGLRASEPATVAALRVLISESELPVIETFQAAGLVSRELEDHYLGRVGLFKNQPADLALAESDLVVAIGYDAVEYDPVIWNSDVDRRIVHIDSVDAPLDNHYLPALELKGDLAQTVAALTPLVSGLQLDEDAADRVARHRSELERIDDAARTAEAAPGTVDPARLVLLMRDLLSDDATVACDIGSNYIFMARHFRVYEPKHLLFSNGQQTLGVSFPWGMAASLLRPGTPVVSVSGDGGFLFSATEIETATRLGLSFTHVIMRDDTYDMVGFQQLLKYGRKSGVQLGDYDIEKFAAAFGATGRRVSGLAEFEEAFRASLAEPGVSIIDVAVDYSRNVDIAAHLVEDAFE